MEKVIKVKVIAPLLFVLLCLAPLSFQLGCTPPPIGTIDKAASGIYDFSFDLSYYLCLLATGLNFLQCEYDENNEVVYGWMFVIAEEEHNRFWSGFFLPLTAGFYYTQDGMGIGNRAVMGICVGAQDRSGKINSFCVIPGDTDPFNNSYGYVTYTLGPNDPASGNCRSGLTWKGFGIEENLFTTNFYDAIAMSFSRSSGALEEYYGYYVDCHNEEPAMDLLPCFCPDLFSDLQCQTWYGSAQCPLDQSTSSASVSQSQSGIDELQSFVSSADQNEIYNEISEIYHTRNWDGWIQQSNARGHTNIANKLSEAQTFLSENVFKE